jgi:hypothetical protein
VANPSDKLLPEYNICNGYKREHTCGKQDVGDGSDAMHAPPMTLDTVSLRLFNLSSGRWTKLDTGAVAFPEWSHDGQWIYYVRWTADPQVLRIRATDGKQK